MKEWYEKMALWAEQKVNEAERNASAWVQAAEKYKALAAGAIEPCPRCGRGF